MPVFYEHTYPIDIRDTDPFGNCRPSGVLGFLQEAALTAAGQLQAAGAELADKYNAFWMLVRVWYRLDRPLRWGEAVTVKTWHRGAKGASSYRDYDLSVDGKRVGEGVSSWVIADVEQHKLLRVSALKEFTGTDGEALCKDKLLSKLRLPEGLTLAERRRLHYSDADVNGHVNNSRYADFACDALRMEEMGPGPFVSSLQIGYLAECRPGEVLELYTATEGDSSAVRGADETGKARFEAVLTVNDISR